MDPAIAEGVRLFNTQKFFEAHEALEAVWLKAHGEEKILLHGLIQVAAAFHHYRRDNPAGFRSLLEKGSKKLDKFGASACGLNLAALRRQLRPWHDFLNHAQADHARPASFGHCPLSLRVLPRPVGNIDTPFGLVKERQNTVNGRCSSFLHLVIMSRET